jgi:hypothetical protein
MSLSDPPTIEDKIVAAIHELCHMAGGIYEYPDARRTRDVFSKFGLMIRERPKFETNGEPPPFAPICERCRCPVPWLGYGDGTVRVLPCQNVACQPLGTSVWPGGSPQWWRLP